MFPCTLKGGKCPLRPRQPGCVPCPQLSLLGSCPVALPGAASVSLPSTLSPVSYGSFFTHPSNREPAGDKQGLGAGHKWHRR